MSGLARIERALEANLAVAVGPGCPPKLAGALRHSLFPGGARVRPRLCLAVAMACGDDDPDLTDAAASAIEILHCASLVHDDLPCFDDASLRRGQPSVHAAYGEPLAVLAGDAMIVLAFQAIARQRQAAPERLAAVLDIVGRGVAAATGIVGGQAWESEPVAELSAYQRAKTGALFVAATTAGAAAAGGDQAAWETLGAKLGEAYQVADDLRDAVAEQDEMGKPCGQDVIHGRPNAALEFGVRGAAKHLTGLLDAAVASIPPCDGAQRLRDLVFHEAKRLVPKSMAKQAA